MKLHDYIYLLILSIVTLYIWYPLTSLVLQWESYTYLNWQAYHYIFSSTWVSLANFDVQSMLTGAILANLFGLNMSPYFWVEIVSILVINICVYFLVKTLTNNSLTAFFASFIFAVYFFGIGFFVPNYYATFLQRVILNVPLLLVSFLFLHRFLAEKKAKHYGYSILLFFVSILLAHFGIFLTIPILLYPIFTEITRKLSFRSFFRGLFISSPYAVSVLFFLLIQKLWGEQFGPKQNILNFFNFLTHTEVYLDGIARQLVYMSQYPTVIDALKSGYYPLAFSDPISTYKFVYPILLTYVIAFLVVWIKGKKYRALLLTVVSGLIIGLLSNIYLGRFDVLHDAGANRYYYYPSFWWAIFWSLVLTVIRNKKATIIAGSIVLGYFFINAALFRFYFSDVKRNSVPTIKLSEYIVRNYHRLPPDSLVIVGPSAYFGPYETTFFTEQIGQKKNILFRTEDVSYGDWRTLASTSAHLVTLTYDKSCACVKEESPR